MLDNALAGPLLHANTMQVTVPRSALIHLRVKIVKSRAIVLPTALNLRRLNVVVAGRVSVFPIDAAL